MTYNSYYFRGVIMNDKRKFIKMTKPIRFRRLRLIKQTIKDWKGHISYVIKYNICNILYKLKILKRYDYRDSGIMEIPLPPYKREIVLTPLCVGTINLRLVKSYNFEIDHFMRSKKNSNANVIVFKVSDYSEVKYILTATLTDIKVYIDCKLFAVDEHPYLKAWVLSPFQPDPKNPKYEVKRYNLSNLQKLRKQYIINDVVNNDTVSKEVIDYYLKCSIEDFEKYLKNMTLKDLEESNNE